MLKCVLRYEAIMAAAMFSGTVVFSEFVSIGNPGNAADGNGLGSVPYSYEIGKYEVSAAEFQAAIDADPRVGRCANSSSQPAGGISWYSAAKYCNWLTSGDVYKGAYKFDESGGFSAVDREAALNQYKAVYALPTRDEWYKAAYFTGYGYSQYADGTEKEPVSGENGVNYKASSVRGVRKGPTEQNGTMNMMGNVWEWTEQQVRRGGAYTSGSGHLRSKNEFPDDPEKANKPYGFRIIKITELHVVGGKRGGL